MADQNNPDFTIRLNPQQEIEFNRLQEVYGSPSIEVENFLECIVQEQIIILNAIEEKAHARIH